MAIRPANPRLLPYQNCGTAAVRSVAGSQVDRYGELTASGTDGGRTSAPPRRMEGKDRDVRAPPAPSAVRVVASASPASVAAAARCPSSSPLSSPTPGARAAAAVAARRKVLRCRCRGLGAELMPSVPLCKVGTPQPSHHLLS